MENIPFDDEKRLDELCERIQIELYRENDSISVFLNGKNVTREIRTPEMSLGSSSVSSVARVRDHMVRLQREMGRSGGVVAEGRDMGTVVFPETRAKFYLDASSEERARRRWRQLKEMGQVEDLKKVQREMVARDHMDSSREHSPLTRADDAVQIDTTGMTIEEVVEKIEGIVRELEG